MKQDLLEALKEEIEGEKQQQSATPPKIPGFDIKCDEAHVKLTKTHGDEKYISADFHANNFTPKNLTIAVAVADKTMN